MHKSFWLLLGLAVLVGSGGVSMLWVSDTNLDRVSAGVQAILLGGVFVVTAFYAKETAKIAQATMTVANEAARQRQNDFLPIIDIVPDPKDEELIAIGLKEMQGEFPESISCLLTNVGRGPAFDCRYQAVHSRDQVTELVEPTFLVGHVMDSVLGPRPQSDSARRSKLALRAEPQPDGSRVVRITYRDVFGQKWSSTKRLLQTESRYLLGPLHFEELILHS